METSLSIEIITPEGKVFTGAADGVVLPTSSGDINVLPGHIPLTTQLKPGEVIVSCAGKEERLVVDKGFARVFGEKISILTEAAIDTDEIDLAAVEAAEAQARAAFEAARTGRVDPAEMEKLEQILRFAAVQKLLKRPR